MPRLRLKELLTSHHWHICDHNAHAARYCVENGATLCYTCHIRGVHQRADHFSTSRIERAVANVYRDEQRNSHLCIDLIEELANVEVTTTLLRALYDEMRKRVVRFERVVEIKPLGKKWFLTSPAGVPQRAVVGHVAEFCGLRYEITGVSNALDENGKKCFRYAATLMKDAE